MPVFLLLPAALLLLAGCSESEPAKPEVVADQAAPVVEQKATPLASEWQVIDAFEVGRDVYVRSMVLDPKQDSLWVGTSTGVHEVNLANQGLRNTFTRADGLANEYVFAMYVAQDGAKWFGTNGGGMSRYQDGQWRVFFPMHGLADYWVYSFAQQANGAVWIGTWAGVNRWVSDEQRLDTFVEELVNEWVYGIDVDSKDRVWFATEGGVSMYDNQQWKEWTHKDGLGGTNELNLPISFNTGLGTRSRHDLTLSTEGTDTFNPNYVFSILVDDKDHVWAGTWGGGVSVYDGQKWRNYTTKDGLAGNVVYAITRATDGSLWFGTDKGVSRFDGKHWTSLGRGDGLLNEHVYAVAVVPAQGARGEEVWLGSRGGVTRLGKAAIETAAGDNKVQQE